MPTGNELSSHAAVQTLPRIAMALEQQNIIAIHNAQMEQMRFAYSVASAPRFPARCKQDECPVCGGKDA